MKYIVYVLCGVLVALVWAHVVKSKNQSFWSWMFRGPIVEERQSEHGVFVRYANGDIFLFHRDGNKLNMTDVLYFKPRTWHLCGTRYGENGTVATVSNYNYAEVMKLIARHYGPVTSEDIITGMISYRISSEN
jgi:hypothetical protein